MKPLTLVMIFILLGICLYGFFKARDSVQIFIIVMGVIGGLVAKFINYFTD